MVFFLIVRSKPTQKTHYNIFLMKTKKNCNFRLQYSIEEIPSFITMYVIFYPTLALTDFTIIWLLFCMNSNMLLQLVGFKCFKSSLSKWNFLPQKAQQTSVKGQPPWLKKYRSRESFRNSCFFKERSPTRSITLFFLATSCFLVRWRLLVWFITTTQDFMTISSLQNWHTLLNSSLHCIKIRRGILY